MLYFRYNAFTNSNLKRVKDTTLSLECLICDKILCLVCQCGVVGDTASLPPMLLVLFFAPRNFRSGYYGFSPA